MALELWVLSALLIGALLSILGIRRIYIGWMLEESAKRLRKDCENTLYQSAPHIYNRPTKFKIFVETMPRKRLLKRKERRLRLSVLLSEKEDDSQVESIVTECVTAFLNQKGNEEVRVFLDYGLLSPQLETANGNVRDRLHQ